MLTPELQTCLEMLCKAASEWENGDQFHDHPIVLAVATTLSARVIRADGWLPLDGFQDHQKLIDAINAPANNQNSQIIFEQSALLLGASGIAEFNRDAAQARRENKIPLAVVLVPSCSLSAHMVVGIPKPKLN